jgi:hypothetical protein
MTYQITEYSKQQANKYNLVIKPSTKANKKIDVYDLHGEFLGSIGDSRYADYPYYIKTKGKEYADKRRELYYLRHGREKGERYSKDWLAKTLLW